MGELAKLPNIGVTVEEQLCQVEKLNNKIKYSELQSELSIDCKNCSGLCCVALYFSKTEGFPANKDAGKPCQNLMKDFRCNIHSELTACKMKGCLAYDCFGAGQKVTQMIYKGENWKSTPQIAAQMFTVFLIIFQLNQMLWYLLEAWKITKVEVLKLQIDELIIENRRMTQLLPDEILKLNIDKYRMSVNHVLKQAGELLFVEINGTNHRDKQTDLMGKNFRRANLSGKDLSMTLLIAANLEGCNLKRTNFLGADMRDANIENVDLSESLFLTQGQINSARGNQNTKLPKTLYRPMNW